MRTRQRGRLYEIPILIALVLLLGAGLVGQGLSWRALAGPLLLIGILVGLALFGMTLSAIGQAWTRRRIGRALDKLVAGEPAEPIVEALRKDSWLVPPEVLKRERLFELATQAGPSRAAILRLLARSSDDAVKKKLRPLVRERLDLLEEREFEMIQGLFYLQDDEGAIATALLARASPPVRRELLKQVFSGYRFIRGEDKQPEWVRQWSAIVAPYRDDLLALRDPARTLDAEAIDALTR